jgi:YVTN family beta-propeller protein
MKSHLALPLLVLSLALPTLNAQSGRLLVAEKGDKSLGIVDPASGKVIATVAENGNTGHEVVASPDGRFAYVPIYGDSGVGKPGTNGTNMVVIDIAAAKITGNVDFGHGIRPHLPVMGPKDGLLYVSTELDHDISIIDPKTLKIIGTLPTGQPESHMFTISSDNRRAYSANVGPGTVSVIDVPTRKLITIIPVSNEVQRISITPNNRYVFTSDVKTPRLAVIDTATNKVIKWIDMPGHGYGSAVTKDGRYVLIALLDTNKMAAIDIKTMQVAHTIDLPKSPQEVLVTPDGKTAYVSSMGADLVSQIDLATWKVTRQIKTGKTTDGLGWAASK